MIELAVSSHLNPAQHPSPSLSLRGDTWVGQFQAMASPCEVLLEGVSQPLAAKLICRAAEEAWRIEHKFSRYRGDNLLHAIHQSAGKPVEVDEEMARLLDYAAHCFELSDGLFDVTSGVLRKVWRFDGSDRLPEPGEVAKVLPYVGWQRLSWQAPYICLKPGMEIDLGGIGKEYAVDRTLVCLMEMVPEKASGALGVLVNYGGDIACAGERSNGGPWSIGVESPIHQNSPIQTLSLTQGGVATSGDTHRFLQKNGVRYSHILDPRDGWPVKHAPHTVTVIAQSCTLAGMLATFAMLQGEEAENFLAAQPAIRYWVQR